MTDDHSMDQADQALSADHFPGHRSINALLSNLRHELRAPSNAIVGFSEMLLEDARQLGHAQLVPDLGKVHTAGKRLLALLEEILDPAKIKASGIDVTSEAFGSHVRHDLRTPLNAIIGYSELLLESAEEDGLDAVTADLRRIHAAAQRLLEMIDDIISLSRVEPGKTGLALDLAGRSPIVHDVMRTIRSLTTGGGGAGQSEGGSLLVVDDNDMNRDMLRRQLERQGHRVVEARNGREALDLVRGAEFDLILLDMVMPEINGYEVLCRLKVDDALRHIPVIMISALDEMESIVRCIEMGADDYLPKPFNPVLLRARLGSSLEKKRLRDRERDYLEQLRVERENSERLLLNILPHPIAQRLKRGEAPIADAFPEATVLFADVVGFTRLATMIPASALVALLDDVFSAFDELAEQHGLEKIKTIGDAYMAVSGVPTPRADHVEAAATMALALLEVAAQVRTTAGRPFSIRIGINTGPLIAGVIGKRKFVYDLWGDTVNTASRIESHGLPDRIGVSAAVYERLRDRYDFEERGLVTIKDKGEMPVYLLNSKKVGGIAIPPVGPSAAPSPHL